MVALQSSPNLDGILPIAKRIIDQWKYKYNKGALVVDIDDTILYQNGDSSQVYEKMRDFLLYANTKQGKRPAIDIFFVTARTTEIKDETEKDLCKFELPYKQLYLMKPGTNTDFVQISKWKHSKRELISKTHDIIFTIGDMWTDIVPIEKESDIDKHTESIKLVLKNSYPFIIVSLNDQPASWGIKVPTK
jgi:predicted secreted acid phosphatase